MKVDYIIVGFGIAGICFSKQLLDQNKSFIVISDSAPGATQNSGGVFNPIVLRRFTAPENNIKYTDYAIELYHYLQKYTSEKWMYPNQNVYRIFTSIEEQNNWFTAADKPHLKPFISPSLQKNSNPYVSANFGLGKVIKSFRIDAETFLHSLHQYFLATDRMKEERFDYTKLHFHSGNYPWQYKSIKAKAILFAEGTHVSENPYLTSPVIRPNKGEYLIIQAPKLKLNYILKGGVYIIPLKNNCYKVGATYSHDDSTKHPTELARKEIETKLQKMIACEYKVIDQITGIRPVTIDRQPILGEIKKGMYIFNGLGSRGFTRGPYYSKLLYNAIESKQPVPANMDVKRFLT